MIEYSSFLIVPALISSILVILVSLLYKWTFKSKRKNIWIGITAFLFFYSLIVGGAALSDIKYQKYLHFFDLNKDGLFSGNEITFEQKAAESKLTNDVGRNFAVFTAVLFGGIMGIVAFFIAWLIDKYKRLTIEEKTKHNKRHSQSAG